MDFPKLPGFGQQFTAPNGILYEWNGVAWLATGDLSVGLISGAGEPTMSAPQGMLYSRVDATTPTTRLYINTDGGTTWASFTASA